MQNTLTSFLFIISLSSPLTGADWHQWRGPNRNGKIESQLKFSKETQFQTQWSAEVGIGFSSMVVFDELLVTMGHSDDKDRVICLSTITGEQVWQQAYDAALDPNLFEGGPTSTPAIYEEKVYSISRQGFVNCFQLKTGEVIWQYDIKKELKLNVPTWGFAGSPLFHEDKLILNAGSHGICLNAQSGKLEWSSSNDVDAGYSSPILIQTSAYPIVVLLNAKEVNAVNPMNGELIWTERWITRYGINAADPLILNEHQLLVSSGYGKGTALIEFDGGESGLVWRNRDVRTQMSPGVVVEDAVYAIDGDAGDEPRFVCFDPQTGDAYWSVENFGSGTLIAVNSQVLVLDETGQLTVLASNHDKFNPITTARFLEGKYWTPPVIVGNRLYVRNASGKVTCSEVH